MTAVEYGVEWCYDDGRTHVGASINRAGAEKAIAEASGSGWSPRAVRVMRRDVGPWVAADAVEVAS